MVRMLAIVYKLTVFTLHRITNKTFVKEDILKSILFVLESEDNKAILLVD